MRISFRRTALGTRCLELRLHRQTKTDPANHPFALSAAFAFGVPMNSRGEPRDSWEKTARGFAFLSVCVVNSASMRLKATLPVFLLLLLAGQLSAELCMAQCQSMRMTEPACAMHEMSHGHCASCKHASANGTNASLATMETCSGQTCNNVLGLEQSRSNTEIRPSVKAVSFDILPPPVVEDTDPVRFRDARSTRSIPPFDPLISSLRI